MTTTVHDSRAGSTLDAPSDQLDPLSAIAAEEGLEAANLAAGIEAEAAISAAQEAAALTGEWRQAIEAAKDLITSMFPAAVPVWTAPRMDNLAAAVARCDATYGWGGVGSLFAHPLVGLAVAGFPLAIGTVQVVKADAEKAKQAKGLPGIDGAAVVVPNAGPQQPTSAQGKVAPLDPALVGDGMLAGV